MISNEARCHYIAVTKLFALLRGVTSKHNGDIYCLNRLPWFRREKRIKSLTRVCRNRYFFSVGMRFEENMLLEFNQYLKSNEVLSLFYAGLYSLIK